MLLKDITHQVGCMSLMYASHLTFHEAYRCAATPAQRPFANSQVLTHVRAPLSQQILVGCVKTVVSGCPRLPFTNLHQNATTDALMAVMLLQALAVAGILLLLMTKNLAPSNVLGFCVAASNAFGLIAGIFLMGYGLVAVPRELWRTADTKNYRKMLFHRAGVQAEKAMSAHA